MNKLPRNLDATRPIDIGAEPDFALGDVLVRPSLREVSVGDRRQTVEPRVMQAMVALGRADGGVVSRDRLIERCWGGLLVGDDAINSCIAKVRALAALTSPPAFGIETVPRVGYRLIPAQKAAEPEQHAQEPAGGQARARGGRRSGFPAVLAIVAVAAAAVLIASMLMGRDRGRPQASQPAQMVAVLPFTPLYADKNAQSYADEISLDVADTLNQTDLNVISPSQSFQFRGDAKARAVRALHATILVDGDVRREGNTLNVAVRIEDISSGIVLLAQNIQRPISEAADLPDQVATFIAGALGWDMSIRALNSGGQWSPRVRTGILRAVDQCPHRQAPLCTYEIGRSLVSEAPDNAIAQTILAIGTTNALDRLPESERATATATARKAAWTAIRLDPHMGEPYIALSELAANPAASEAYLRRGLAVSPASSGLAGYLSALLYSKGRTEEGLAVIQRVAARYTFLDFAATGQIWALLALGRTRDAVELAKRARRLWPDRRLLEWDLFDAAAFQGNPADAEAMLRDPIMGPILQPAGAPPTLAHIARAMRTRLPVDIDAVSRDCRHFDAADSGRTLPCVLALSALGRIDDAFRLPRDEYWPAMLFWPQTAPMRADPRFQGLTEKLGLFAYWKDTRTRPDFCMVERVAVCQALSSVKG